MIGHIGITTSTGTLYDFGGSFYVSKNNLTFGKPTKVWQLFPTDVTLFDEAVLQSSNEYSNKEVR